MYKAGYIPIDLIEEKHPGAHLSKETAAVEEMMANGKECVRFECKNEAERNRLYHRIYAFTKRRHFMNVKRFVRGNYLYVVNMNVALNTDKKTYTFNVGFNSGDETQFDATGLYELIGLWADFCEENKFDPNNIDYVEKIGICC